jgi:hypothetical protein
MTTAQMAVEAGRISEDERDLLTHVSMWGSDGYPVTKVGSRHWTWSWRGSVNCPVVFPTKRQAVASFESYYAILLDRLAGRL